MMTDQLTSRRRFLKAGTALVVSFAFTGQAKYKRTGLAILKWTLLGVFAFFVVLALERIFA